jgi:signal transduction histidine kinase/CheY-like chemotaxis protein
MFHRLTIGNKLLLVFFFIGIVPAVVLASITLWQSQYALTEQAFNQLESLRELKKAQIDDFWSERRNGMQVLLNTVANLRQTAWQQLQSVQENKNAQIESYFQGRFNDIMILSRSEAVAQSIEQFSEALDLDGGEIGMAWESIKGMLDKELQHYKETLDYEDLLLIDKNGVVVYSTLLEEELGQNLREGEWRDTPLGHGAQTVLATPDIHIEDYFPHPVSGEPKMFVFGPVWRFDKLVGILAFRLNEKNLNDIVLRRKGMGYSGESYLVGATAHGAVYRSQRHIPGKTIIYPLGANVSGMDVDKVLRGESDLLLKYGEDEKLVLSAYAPLNIPGLHWGLITHMDVEEIISPRLENEERDFFSKYLQEYDFYDFLLIHPQGKIFYSVKHEAEYNTNILNGPYAHTHLGVLVRQVLAEREFALSDYGLYAPSNNLPSAFIAQPLLDDTGEVELIVAVQLSDGTLNRIMRQRSGMGQSGETYLVGEDLLLRSNTYLSPDTHSIRASLSNPEQGKINTDSVKLGLAGKSGRLVGTNYLGQHVLSAYMPLNAGTNTWVLVAEIQRNEALAVLRHLQFLMLGVALGTLVLVWFISRRFTAALIKPLVQVNHHLKVLAAGELDLAEIDYHGNGKDEIAQLVHSARRLKISMKSTIAQANAVAAGDYSREMQLLSINDQLGQALSDMTRMLREMNERKKVDDWRKNGMAGLNETMRGVQELPLLSKNIIEFIAHYLNAPLGLFYVYHPGHKNENGIVRLSASYAYAGRKERVQEFSLGEGLVGQAARDQELIVVRHVPQDYLHIHSGLGSAVPQSLTLLPILYENELKAVLELGTFHPLTQIDIEFLQQIAPIIGIGVYTASSRARLEELLAQSQSQAEELQSQAEELEVQQEELRQSNEELEERTRELQRQQDAIREKNMALEEAKQGIELKAHELELASKYKSEFLANMSHELRTPLNSLLILAQMLANNKDGNLTEKQVEYARTMHHAGNDLLNLINEILDLSKIEAGKIELHPEEIKLSDVLAIQEQRFRHMAEDKGLHFILEHADDAPEIMFNDAQRVQQVLTNLISNAFKFTPQNGTVTLSIRRPTPEQAHAANLAPETSLYLSVADSGIGIPQDKHAQVFEAFQQADGSTSRKYGGTGLGLSICRQLVHLMGGEISLESEEGKGSIFSLCIPEQVPGRAAAARMTPPQEAKKMPPPQVAPAVAPTPKSAAVPPPSSASALSTRSEPSVISGTNTPQSVPKVRDDRDNLNEGSRILLIIEDDPDFAVLLMELARDKHFKCVIAADGAEGLALAQQYTPHAIVLDIGLPQVNGLTVLERLKDDPLTRHIPIHCVSGSEQDMDARKMGAIGYLLKPVGMEEIGDAFKKIEHFINKQVKNLLLLADHPQRQQTLFKLLGSDAVDATLALNRDEAWLNLQMSNFDCLVIDTGQKPDDRLQLLEKLLSDSRLQQLPVILYGERELSEEEDALLLRCTEKLVIKPVRSPERLLDETTLFLHQVEATLPKEQQILLSRLHNKESIFQNKKVLLVDDDMRNIYSLTAVLEERGMVVDMAKNGVHALEVLSKRSDFDIILMDIMMPEMDGYETMRRIRAQAHFRKTPMLALTAKAMKGDKAKCIEAGANDYLSKPVDTDKLLSLMRVWLYR